LISLVIKSDNKPNCVSNGIFATIPLCMQPTSKYQI
jgi:hypothetical protein